MDWFIMCWYINYKYSSIVNVIPSTAKPCSHKQNPWVEKETFQDFLSPSCYICTSKEIVAPHSIFTTLILHAKHVWNPLRKLAFEHLKYFGKSLRNYILPHLQWSVEENVINYWLACFLNSDGSNVQNSRKRWVLVLFKNAICLWNVLKSVIY